MAVIAVWKCDRDGSMFDNKKDAEEHDKMLELAANITSLIEQEVQIDEDLSEAIGLLLAKRRDALAKACKGKPEILLEADAESDPESNSEPNTVTSIAAGQ
ncbi:YebG family protein [Pseudomaricurvus sp.]|uniref:YebG family protein n=1 Tax=Pseudomaricurvus sp. TaxID=2004510 RepID=UPI003F6CF650